jgi:hypothetical protein
MLSLFRITLFLREAPMAKTASEILASALERALNAASGNIVRSSDINPRHKTLLVKSGYLKLIIKGWYILDADVSGGKTGDSVL